MRAFRIVFNRYRARVARWLWVEEKTQRFTPPSFLNLFNEYSNVDTLYHAALRAEDKEKAAFLKGRRDAIRDIMDAKI